MERKIWIFGNPDKSDSGFAMPGDLQDYLRQDIFVAENGRYRYTLARHADIIVLSRDGIAYGHLYIEEKVKPTDADRESYSRVTNVYLVRKSSLYEKPVQLSNMEVKGLSFGYKLDEGKFQELLDLAGKITDFHGGVELPESTADLESILQEVKRRLGQSDFRAALVEAYGGKCAVTGCDAVFALEAAHIVPHSNIESNDPRNGLLLRADIHTLFDRHLLGINPDTKKIAIAPQLLETYYGKLNEKELTIPNDTKLHPKHESLKHRWTQFTVQEQ
jgi:hypothetical protein